MGLIDLNKREGRDLNSIKVPRLKKKIGTTFKHMTRHEVFDRHRVVEIINAYRAGRKHGKGVDKRFIKECPYMHMHLKYAWEEGFNATCSQERRIVTKSKGGKKKSVKERQMYI